VVIPGWLEPIARLASTLFRAEKDSMAGRLNFFLMLLSLLLVFVLALPPWLEAIVHIFRPSAQLDFPIVEIVATWLIFNLICIALVGYLDIQSKKRRQR
jgi:hypothetical protein